MKSMFKGALGALTVMLALCGFTATSALAAGAPIVETKPATGVHASEATLKGVVNANGAATKYYFEYGTTTSYGSKTAEATQLGTVEASKLLTGLPSLTAYHFRIVAKNSNGTTYGADETFTTITALPEFAVKSGIVTQLEWKSKWAASALEIDNANLYWTCTSGSFNGSVIAAKTVKGTVIFNACKTKQTSCRSEGAEPEEVKTAELEGTLVYLSKSAKTVGLELKPKSGEFVIPKFTCYGASAEARGSIIFPINAPVNKPSKGLSWGNVYSKNGVQEVDEYENEAGTKVHSGMESNWLGEGWTPFGWDIPANLSETNKEFEIKA